MMGLINQRNQLVKCIIILLMCFCYGLPFKLAEGRKYANNIETKLKGTIKTIKSENGEVIDCVDIYKQPAFDHPLLKNHTIQMGPSNGDKKLLIQEWNKNGEFCPRGSIPILRLPKFDYPKKVPLNIPRPTSTQQDLNSSLAFNPESPGHEYAIASFVGENYGASAVLNTWTPDTVEGDISLAEMSQISGDGDGLNAIEVGWIVSGLSEPRETRTFVYWTNDNYKSTGCYNLLCPGFIQTSTKVSVGALISPVSIYDGTQNELQISTTKEKDSGDWWLTVQGERVGYWPNALFKSAGLGVKADSISWGGEVVSQGKDGKHTGTRMGSGHFPNEGLKKASYFKNLKYFDGDKAAFLDPLSVVTRATKPSCYDIKDFHSSDFGVHFFYGGPGYSDTCLIL